MEYKNQVKKKLIQKQLNLKHLVDKIEAEVNDSDLLDDEKSGILWKITDIKEDGEFRDLVKLAEIQKFKSYDEFEVALRHSDKVTHQKKQKKIADFCLNFEVKTGLI